MAAQPIQRGVQVSIFALKKVLYNAYVLAIATYCLTKAV